MKTTIRITAQVYENKAWYEGGESWRPKFGQEFVMEVAEGILMYTPESEIVKVLKEQIAQQSDDMMKYEYIEHDIVFQDTIQLDGTLFDEAFTNKEEA